MSTMCEASVAPPPAATAPTAATHAAATAASAAPPVLRRAARVTGKTLVLRDATTADASFIVGLRTDPVKGAHLSATPADIGRQQAWLRAYGERDDEAYFIITAQQAGADAGAPGAPALGTVRLYAPRGDAFCWGSWILAAEAPASAGIESALMVYAYALDHLGFASAHFEVQSTNERVWAFHERFGAVRSGVQEGSFHYTLAGDAIRASMARYRRHLPAGVEVRW